MGGATKACIASFCGAALIASIVMIAVSFGVLQNNQLGLNHDTISQSIDKSTLYTSGRHFIGLGHKFVVYPQLQQSLIYSTAADATEPPIVSRTSEGLPVTLSVAFNYRYNPDISQIVYLYVNFGDAPTCEQVFSRVAKNWIRTIASNFTAFEFFLNRSTIQGTMQSVLSTQLDNFYVSVDSLQLLDAELPAAFNDARAAQSAAYQDISVATAQQAVARDQAAASVAVALQNFQLLLLQAEAQASVLAANAEATITSLTAKYAAEASSLSAVMSNLTLTQQQLLSYLWLKTVKTASNTGLTVNVPVPTIFQGTNF